MASAFAIANNDMVSQDSSIAGIAHHCKVVSLRVADPWGYVDSDNVIDAIEYSIEKGFNVLNMSFGGYYDPAGLHAVIQKADSVGIIMVAGAGDANRDADVQPIYPASYPEVIKAAAVDVDGSKWWTGEYDGSDYGSDVDVCAFASTNSGRRIIVTSYEEGPLYHLPGSSIPRTYALSMGKTSYAAAEVSALACLLRSMYPSASSEFIRKEIKRGAVPVDMAPGNVGKPWQYKLGAGRINAYRSLTQWGRIRSDTT